MISFKIVKAGKFLFACGEIIISFGISAVSYSSHLTYRKGGVKYLKKKKKSEESNTVAFKNNIFSHCLLKWENNNTK